MKQSLTNNTWRKVWLKSQTSCRYSENQHHLQKLKSISIKKAIIHAPFLAIVAIIEIDYLCLNLVICRIKQIFKDGHTCKKWDPNTWPLAFLYGDDFILLKLELYRVSKYRLASKDALVCNGYTFHIKISWKIMVTRPETNS